MDLVVTDRLGTDRRTVNSRTRKRSWRCPRCSIVTYGARDAVSGLIYATSGLLSDEPTGEAICGSCAEREGLL